MTAKRRKAVGGRPAAPRTEHPDAVVSAAVPAGVRYPSLLRTDPPSPTRAVVGVAAALVLYLVVSAVVSSTVVAVGYLVEQPGTADTAYRVSAANYERPVGMLASTLAIAAVIPVCWLLITRLHRVSFRWLSSVQPGLRWRYLFLCLGVAAVILYSIAAIPAAAGPMVTFRPQPGFVGFAVVIVLVTPLQSAAEEYLFRGYLLQAMGSWFASPWFGVVFSSVLFAAFHGGQNLPLFLDRLGFGLLAAVLVLKTGGLEASIAAHIVNNVGAYTAAGLTASIAELRAVRSLGWVDALVDVAGFAAFTLAAILIARLLRLRVTTPAGPGLSQRATT